MISARLVGADQALAGLRAISDAANAGMARIIADLGSELRRRVQQDKLGGQPLASRSGRLRSSIDLEVGGTATTFTATVSTGLDYAHAQEFGLAGVVSVRESMRRIRQAFGRPIAEKIIDVRAYRRRSDLPGRSFLGSALDEMAPEIAAEVDAALHQALS